MKKKKKTTTTVKSQKKCVEIFTDGSCLQNKAGGWGALIAYPDGRKSAISAGVFETTSPAMEVRAVVEALNTVKNPSHIVVKTDCEYVVKGVNDWLDNWERNNWKSSKNKTISHQEHWQQIKERKEFHKSVKCVHVPAHSNKSPRENLIVDILAKDEALAIKK